MLVALGFALAPMEAHAIEGAGTNSGQVPRRAEKTATGKTTKTVAVKKRKKVPTRTKQTEAVKAPPGRTRLSRAARLRAAREQAHTINDNVEITPFPSHAAAARKALAQNRRDQLDDAEKAARDPRQDDRWQTVLFHLRGFDSRADAEACFWRVIAYYRLGEIGRARTIRQSCEIDTRDLPVIEKEDVQSASLQPATALPELAAAGERAPAPVQNPAGYEGAAPTRLER
ncbi:MAG TPA: hypothetical protein VIK30_11970 [Polyangia bacterium]